MLGILPVLAELFLLGVFLDGPRYRTSRVLKQPSNGLCQEFVRCMLHQRFPLAMEVMNAAGAQEAVQESRYAHLVRAPQLPTNLGERTM
jgi:hypothetical protein